MGAVMVHVACVADVGAAVRGVRKRLGMSQGELALAAGVGVRFLVELERGKPSVRFELVLRVIEALGGTLELSWEPPGERLADNSEASN
jgi:HTH-type transcriptional regulator/antitoxin HipB